MTADSAFTSTVPEMRPELAYVSVTAGNFESVVPERSVCENAVYEGMVTQDTHPGLHGQLAAFWGPHLGDHAPERDVAGSQQGEARGEKLDRLPHGHLRIRRLRK